MKYDLCQKNQAKELLSEKLSEKSSRLATHTRLRSTLKLNVEEKIESFGQGLISFYFIRNQFTTE